MPDTEGPYAEYDQLKRHWGNGNGHGRSEFLRDSAVPLRITDPTALQGLPVPERRWLVDDWLPWGTVFGMYGAGGEGKTLLAQQLMTCTAIGRPWLGRPTAPVRSLGFFCEDPEDELHRRQADINRLYGVEFASLGNMRWISRFGDDNIMIAFSNGRAVLTPFFHQALEEARDFKAQLVIVDTVADTFGGNENDRSQVNQFVKAALGRIAREIDGCVLACAHPSRSGTASGEGDGGSTGWKAGFRSQAYLHRPAAEDGEQPDGDLRVLTRKKANYAARDDEIRLRWRAGAFATEIASLPSHLDKKDAERVFLDLLDATAREGRPMSDSSRAPSYAPKIFRRRREANGFKVADFERAMESLFAQRIIITETYGRKSDLRRRIVRAPEAQ